MSPRNALGHTKAKAKPARSKSGPVAGQSAKEAGEDQLAARAVIEKLRKSSQKITTSSTAEYFAKNLQQVGFSSPTKAVLTTVKEALDNSLDACEDAGILPEIKLTVHKVGAGTLKNTDQILICVEDNGPGIDPEDVPKVFGEYLASSKFGRGRCSRGQQGIGISAATTWAMQTAATGARVKTRKKGAKKAFSCVVDMDLKNNKGMVKEKQLVDWDAAQGTAVEFLLDGRIQLNGEAGLLNYIRGTILLNPHMSLSYDITDVQPTVVERVSQTLPDIPPATEPHPHTMKLGEFISHARLYGRMKSSSWLKKGFSRINDATLKALVKEQKMPEVILGKNIDALSEDQFKKLFSALQNIKLLAPATTSVLSVGEEALALSVRRLGDIDFFAVLTRKPTICDFKPVQIEVAIARLKQRSAAEMEESVQVLRFANRVPLQFDKAACAIVKAITSVNWRSYGLRQPRNALPLGPYIVAVSVVSPFIKFKNASKETIDASDELVEELRRAMMQTGQRLSRYLAREHKAGELEQRVQHIEQFGPVLIETLARILGASEDRKEKAFTGLAKILEKDTKGIAQDLAAAEGRLASYLEEKKHRLGTFFEELDQVSPESRETSETEVLEAEDSHKGDVDKSTPDKKTRVQRKRQATGKKKS